MDKDVFTGGLLTVWFNVTIPFARLTLTDEEMSLRVVGIRYARRGWSDVKSAQRVVGGLLGSPGVRFVLRSGKPFIFWSFDPERVIRALSRRAFELLTLAPNRPGCGSFPSQRTSGWSRQTFVLNGTTELRVILTVTASALMLVGGLLATLAANIVTYPYPLQRRVLARIGRRGVRLLVVPGVVIFVVGLGMLLVVLHWLAP